MKKLILGAFIMFSVFTTSCTDTHDTDKTKKEDMISTSDIPAAVFSAFSAKYANTTDVKWETAKEDDLKTYKVKFKSADKKMTAEFQENGTFIKEKQDD